MNAFVKRHHDKIAGTIASFDRVIITGTLPDIGYARDMARHLSYHQIKLLATLVGQNRCAINCVGIPITWPLRPS